MPCRAIWGFNSEQSKEAETVEGRLCSNKRMEGPLVANHSGLFEQFCVLGGNLHPLLKDKQNLCLVPIIKDGCLAKVSSPSSQRGD